MTIPSIPPPLISRKHLQDNYNIKRGKCEHFGTIYRILNNKKGSYIRILQPFFFQMNKTLPNTAQHLKEQEG